MRIDARCFLIKYYLCMCFCMEVISEMRSQLPRVVASRHVYHECCHYLHKHRQLLAGDGGSQRTITRYVHFPEESECILKQSAKIMPVNAHYTLTSILDKERLEMHDWSAFTGRLRCGAQWMANESAAVYTFTCVLCLYAHVHVNVRIACTCMCVQWVEGVGRAGVLCML